MLMPLRRFTLVAASALALGAPAMAQSVVDSGAYLAARVASSQSDYAAAARYYSQALTRDPSNIVLLDNAVTAFVGLGKIDSAEALSRRLADAGVRSQVGMLVIAATQVATGDWPALLKEFNGEQQIGPLFDGLARGWALLGAGDATAALAEFDAVADTEGVKAFGLYHKALALAALERFDDAEAILASDADGGLRLTRRGIIARAQILGLLGRHDDAVQLIDNTFNSELDASLQILRDRLAAGETLPFDIARDARGGFAETFQSIANALNGEASENYTLLYTRLAEYLRPDHVEAVLLSAALLESMGQYDLAIETYRRIPRDSPASEAAELGRAEALRNSGKPDAAIEVLQQLVERAPDNAMFRIALGDAQRQLNNFEEARAAYSSAIEVFTSEDPSQWAVYFTRGIANERTDRWEEAEADFRKALKLNPDQPQVLNYLGYSMVEKQENLDEALDMIERAVAARPDSGYITDSLGWVLYRLGRYDEAVEPMERAVELMPVDAVVNDHLGDVYWAVGRYREAEFQWKRALSFADDDESGEADPDRMRRKLEVGLDQVLKEEGAQPLRVANEG